MNNISKIIILFILSLASSFAFADSPINLAGIYHCTVQDQNGETFHSTVTYTLDSKNSNFSKNYSAYHFKGVSQYGTVYLGEAILRGNALAVYTYNASPKKQNDIGLEISTVTQSIDAQGQKQTVLDNLLYDPLDVGGGSTTAITCHN